MVKAVDGHVRITIFLVLVGACFGLVSYRLFVLSYIRHSWYARTAQAQVEHINNILARGNIFFQDKNGATSIAAMNKKFAVLAVTPSKVSIDKHAELAQKLSQITDVAQTTFEKSFATNADTSRIFARRLTDEQVGAIKALDYAGVSIIYEMDRFYPHEGLAADILGFLGYDGTVRAGQYGIESFFNDELFGKVRDGESNLSLASSLLGRNKDVDPITRPSDVILTIDPTVQRFAEEQLDALLKRLGSTAGTVIVQEPTTGKIIAMIDRPSFNPNSYGISEASTFLNTNAQEIFEPGSSFKPFTIAAGIDSGKITEASTFTDTGFVEIDGYRIKNFSENVFGRVTMAQVLEKSINTGTMHVQTLIGNEKFTNYVVNFGFGQQTGIDIPGEVNGDISNLYSGRKINFLTASFGQGIAVTPIQLINGYSTIANGGKLMKPYVVDRVVREGGTEIKTQPEVLGIPITEKTAKRITTMLVSVVNNGFDKARVAGYDIAGKTGTAQIPKGDGGYLEDQYIHNFLGFAPASNPKFTILIKVDKPQGITFAADSLSPAFREMAHFLLKYYNIPPTR